MDDSISRLSMNFERGIFFSLSPSLLTNKHLLPSSLFFYFAKAGCSQCWLSWLQSDKSLCITYSSSRGCWRHLFGFFFSSCFTPHSASVLHCILSQIFFIYFFMSNEARWGLQPPRKLEGPEGGCCFEDPVCKYNPSEFFSVECVGKCFFPCGATIIFTLWIGLSESWQVFFE